MTHDDRAPSRGLGMPEPNSFADTGAAIERALSGNQQAFVELWQRFVPGLQVMLYRRVWRSLGAALRVRLLDEVDDILSQVMASAFRGLPEFTYQGSRSFLAWLCTIAENLLNNRIAHWTAQGRDVRVEVGVAAEGSSSCAAIGLPGATGPGPASVAALDEQRQRVARALAKLPQRSYTILYWRFFSGAAWEEICAMVGAKSADAVRMECFNKAMPAFAAALAEA